MRKIYKSVQSCTPISALFKPASIHAGEKFLLLILVSIGISGFVYVSQNQSYKLNTENFTKVNAYQTALGTSPQFEKETSSTLNPKTNLHTINHLHISGNLESNTKLTFEFSAFHKNAEYQINFGNGHTKIITDRTIQYSYPTAGTFPLTLTASYRGETKTLHKEQLTINDNTHAIVSQL